ncbi:ABC transporter permease [Diplocloster agilis]|uniref:ABC transporter permease n=1 Tax=Diplocloster agilis TaxID=2850323 RepID=A0A949JY85_9FIRM|nr:MULTISPECIES: ABC transporter permease [Lachnospiraceae]MBU9735400.1 ABC transporter permease [Diplocloster agilis]MBU9742252.1 ABC transporter permease [Diplocloster agilis]MCU6734407.1 ABC transporter permease [Suonthocola fibrivorans]SCJ37993.1 Ribose transport system permease protein rbsC [uncultured Clostridium sp.]
MSKVKSLLKNSKSELSTVIMLVVLCIIFGVQSEYFFTFRNIMNIGTYASIMGTMAAGLTVAMLLGGLDVSQYSLAAMAGMIMGMMIEAGFSVPVTLAVTILVGILGGCINAFIITIMRVNPIIATMGTQFIFRGAAFLLTDGRYIRIDDPVYYFIGNGKIFGIPFCLMVMLITYIIVWYLLKYTKYGRQVFAVGGNIQVAKLAGINANRVKFISHIIAGVTAVMGGIITVCQTSSAMPNHGYGNDMDGIAAVILGGIGLAGGKGKVGGTLIGILVLAVLVNGMTLLNVQAYWQQVVKGLVLIFAVFIDALRSSKSKA